MKHGLSATIGAATLCLEAATCLAGPAQADTGNDPGGTATGPGTTKGGGASPNQAIICDPGSGYYSWLAVSKPWKVTHATRYEHFLHSTGTFTRTAAFQRQLSARVSYAVKVSGALQTPIASLGSQTSLTLEADGKATTTSAIRIKETMDDYAVFIYYDGSRDVSGNFIYHRCNAAGTAYRVTSIGDARSYTSPAEGAFNCNTTPPAGSLGAVVKPQYC